ncbi:MAG: DUF3298 domain-containing protein [Rickettsiales endosymbiont of Dermacentor nuttalli]
MKNKIICLFLLIIISVYSFDNAYSQADNIKNDALVLHIKDQISQKGDIISKPNKEKCAMLKADGYNNRYHTENNDECICKADIHYPEIINGDYNVTAKINEYLKKFAEEFGCHDDNSFGEYTLKYKIMSLRNPIVSIEFYYTEDTGGAHGIYGVNTLNFNAKTGDKVLLEDLIYSNNQKKINDYLVEVLKKDPKSFYNSEMQVDFASNDVIKNFETQSFYVTQNGIVLQFNPYEVGPYSSGIITVELPEQFINQDYFTKYVTK